MTKELACSFNYLNAFQCTCISGSFFFLSLQVDWTPELHKKFVQAVEQLGVDQAIPSRILELMKVEGLTRHNVASHLQVSVNLILFHLHQYSHSSYISNMLKFLSQHDMAETTLKVGLHVNHVMHLQIVFHYK